MKKIFIALLAATCAMPAIAQEEPCVSKILNMKATKFAHEGQSAVVEIALDLDGSRIGTKQRWEIIPIIKSGANIKQLAPMVVSGHNRGNMFRRATKLKKSPVKYGAANALLNENVGRRDRKTTTYRTSTPWQEWMGDATLVLNTRLISCSREFHCDDKIAEMSAPKSVAPRPSYIAPVREAIKERAVSRTALIDFAVNRAVVDPSFGRNPVELAKIKAAIDEISQQKDVKMEGIHLTGYASPEGSYANNDRLASQRVAALENYIANNFGVSHGEMSSDYIAEDWDGLRRVVTESSLPDRQAALDIIDNSLSPDAKEAALRSLGSWNTILREMMPPLRRTDYRVDYSVRDYDVADSRTVLKNNPTMLSHYELDALARGLDPRSAEYAQIYKLIEVQNPNDDVANIDVAGFYISRGDWTSATNALARVKEHSPAYWNNYGIVQMMTGNAAAAQNAFSQANNPDAAYNMQFVKK